MRHRHYFPINLRRCRCCHQTNESIVRPHAVRRFIRECNERTHIIEIPPGKISVQSGQIHIHASHSAESPACGIPYGTGSPVIQCNFPKNRSGMGKTNFPQDVADNSLTHFINMGQSNAERSHRLPPDCFQHHPAGQFQSLVTTFRNGPKQSGNRIFTRLFQPSLGDHLLSLCTDEHINRFQNAIGVPSQIQPPLLHPQRHLRHNGFQFRNRLTPANRIIKSRFQVVPAIINHQGQIGAGNPRIQQGLSIRRSKVRFGHQSIMNEIIEKNGRVLIVILPAYSWSDPQREKNREQSEERGNQRRAKRRRVHKRKLQVDGDACVLRRGLSILSYAEKA